MLRITASLSSTAARNYFGKSLSRGDYYLEGQEIAGDWGGQGAAQLGLSGPVEREAFLSLLENRTPKGDRLTARTRLNRRPGYDFTFDVPKSVSLLHSLAGDARIPSAMQRAIAETMQEMEEAMHARVRKNGAFEDRRTSNMVWAEFTHLTSRPAALPPELAKALLGAHPWLESCRDNDGTLALPDPHLHSHVFVLNATFDGTEREWKAGEFMRLKRDAPYYQAAYHARLAGELQKLGYAIEPTADAFEIAGIPRSVVEVFSRRAQEVEEAAKALGITSDAQKDGLAARTRRGKMPSLDMGQLKKLWRAFLPRENTESLDDTALAAESRGLCHAIDNRDAARQGIAHALDHELERASEVSEKRLLARALVRAVGSASVASVQRVFLETPDLLSAKVKDERHITTPAILAEEAELMRYVRAGRGSVAPLDAPAQRGNYLFRSPFLELPTPENKEQREAVQHVLGSQDWVVGVVGRAGTGKTTLLKEIGEAMKHNMTPMILCAPTAEASRGVLRNEGFASADTVKRLLVDQHLQAKLRGAVLWIDEAGMIGNRDMLALMRVAKVQGAAKVVLSGDPTQIRSVVRGDAFRFLEKNAGLSVSRLDHIKRQRNPQLKAAVSAISRGDVGKAFQILEKSGAIIEGEPEKIHAALAKDYAATVSGAASKGRPVSALVISPTHLEGETVTKAIREELKATATLRGEERTFRRTVSLTWTEAQRATAASYTPGLLVEFKRDGKAFKKDERVEVVDVYAAESLVIVKAKSGRSVSLPLGEAKKFQVFAPRELPVCVGESLKITQNTWDVSGKHRLNNGDSVRVVGFSKRGGILLENKRELPRDFTHMAHGYVITADAAQAKTVDVLYASIGADSIGATDMRRVYVALSRARDRAQVYTTDKEELLLAAARDTPRQSATDLLGPDRSREILQNIAHREALRQLGLGLGPLGPRTQVMQSSKPSQIVVPERPAVQSRPDMEVSL